MINWNEVTVGETEIEGKGVPRRWCILGIDDNQVWAKRVDRQYPESVYQIFSKQFINETYNIYDPWEDVSDECEFDDHMHVLHNGRYIGHELVDGGWYRRGPGLRVWKRKEGE